MCELIDIYTRLYMSCAYQNSLIEFNHYDDCYCKRAKRGAHRDDDLHHEFSCHALANNMFDVRLEYSMEDILRWYRRSFWADKIWMFFGWNFHCPCTYDGHSIESTNICVLIFFPLLTQSWLPNFLVYSYDMKWSPANAPKEWTPKQQQLQVYGRKESLHIYSYSYNII